MNVKIVDSLRSRALESLSRLDRRPVASPVHLCHLVQSMGHDGVAGTVLDISNGLNPKYYMVSILCVGDRGPRTQRVDPRVQVFALHAPEVTPRTIWQAARELRRYRVDLLHTHGAPCYPWGAVAARLAGVAHVVHSGYGRGGETPLTLPPPARKLALGWTDRFQADSQQSAEALAGITGAPGLPVTVIPRGVDTEKFRPLVDRQPPRDLVAVEAPGPLVLGMVGPPRESSGHALLLSALGQLVERGLDLRAVLVGQQGPDQRRLEQQAARAGLEDRVCWVGQVPDVGASMAGMDILVWLDPERSGRSTLLEAMACGLPVVAASSARGPSLVRDGETGLLVPPGDAGILVRVLDDLCQDGQRRQKLGRQARAFVEQHHRLEDMVLGQRKLYDEAVGPLDTKQDEERVP